MNNQSNQINQISQNNLHNIMSLKAFYNNHIWKVLTINTNSPKDFIGMERQLTLDPHETQLHNNVKQVVVSLSDVILLENTGIKDVNNNQVYSHHKVKLKVDDTFEGSLSSFKWEGINNNPDTIYTVHKDKGLWQGFKPNGESVLLFDSWALHIEIQDFSFFID